VGDHSAAVADCGFFSRAIIELIETNGATAYIPSQSNVQVRRVVDLKNLSPPQPG